MLVKDLVEVLQTLDPDTEVSLLSQDGCEPLGGGVYFPKLGEVIFLGEDTSMEADEDVLSGEAKEFGKVEYYFDKGKGTAEDEEEKDDSELGASAEEIFTPEVLEALINETKIRKALEFMGKNDPPFIVEGECKEVKPPESTCEEDA